MGHYLRLVMAWLGLGLALTVIFLVVLGGIQTTGGEESGRLGDLAVTAGLPWLGFGVLMGALSYRFEDARLHARSVGYLGRTLNGLLLIIILIGIARILFAFIPGFEGLVRWVDGFMGAVWASGEELMTHLRMPLEVQGFDLAPVLVVVLLLLARNAVTWAQISLTPAETRKAMAPPPRQKGKVTRDESRARSIARKVAVASYSEAKALLASTQMELTFLALDIVGSTTMKAGEDPFVIEQSFSDYRKLVERMLRRHGAYKQTWTPDGQMAAFRSAQSAVDCGRDILLALPDFNRNTSKMRQPFRLRVGANTGVVSADDEVPMEEMSDFTIDIAGHMQKYAEGDSIWIADETYEQLADRSGFSPNGEEVDGKKVYVWKRPS